MSKRGKIHLFVGNVHQDTDEIGYAACGLYRFDLVKDFTVVTCEHCLRHLRALAPQDPAQSQNN